MERRIIAAARVSLSAGGGLDENLIRDVCDGVGVHPYAFRQFFPTDDALLDAVHSQLVDECAQRLRAGVDRFAPGDPGMRYVDAARLLAESWPLDKGGMIIRGERRVRALAGKADGQRVARSERRFLGELVAVLTDLTAKMGRSFTMAPELAVRLILDTYERSFEAWILDGNPELAFEDSPYIRRTLPTLLEELTHDTQALAARVGAA